MVGLVCVLFDLNSVCCVFQNDVDNFLASSSRGSSPQQYFTRHAPSTSHIMPEQPISDEKKKINSILALVKQDSPAASARPAEGRSGGLDELDNVAKYDWSINNLALADIVLGGEDKDENEEESVNDDLDEDDGVMLKLSSIHYTGNNSSTLNSSIVQTNGDNIHRLEQLLTELDLDFAEENVVDNAAEIRIPSFARNEDNGDSVSDSSAEDSLDALRQTLLREVDNNKAIKATASESDRESIRKILLSGMDSARNSVT